MDTKVAAWYAATGNIALHQHLGTYGVVSAKLTLAMQAIVYAIQVQALAPLPPFLLL